MTNAAEFAAGSDPNDQDSDNDDASDSEEQLANTDPLDGSEFSSALTQLRLVLERDTLRFDAKLQPGGEAAPQQVKWQNIGGGNLLLQANSADTWIQPRIVSDPAAERPASGHPAAAQGYVQVALNTGSLSKGFHSGVVRLSAAAGSDLLIGEQRCIGVNTWVLAADDDLPGSGSVQDKTIYLPFIDK